MHKLQEGEVAPRLLPQVTQTTGVIPVNKPVLGPVAPPVGSASGDAPRAAPPPSTVLIPAASYIGFVHATS